jgi:hypothetical protein
VLAGVLLAPVLFFLGIGLGLVLGHMFRFVAWFSLALVS